MPHAQQIVINAVQAALVAANTVAGARVFADRTDPLQPTELPAILIDEAQGETAEAFDLQGRQKRTLSLQVQCILAQSQAAAQAREFGLAAEKAIESNATLQTLCSLGVAIQSSAPITNGDGDRLTGTRLQQWQFAYVVDPLNPENIL